MKKLLTGAVSKAKKVNNSAFGGIKNVAGKFKDKFTNIQIDEDIEANIEDENFDWTASLHAHLRDEEWNNETIIDNASATEEKIGNSASEVIESVEAILPKLVISKDHKTNKTLKEMASWFNKLNKDSFNDKWQKIELTSTIQMREILIKNKDRIIDALNETNTLWALDVPTKDMSDKKYAERILWIFSVKHWEAMGKNVVKSYKNELKPIAKARFNKTKKRLEEEAKIEKEKKQTIINERNKELAPFFKEVAQTIPPVLSVWLKGKIKILKEKVFNKELEEEFYADIILFLVRANIPTKTGADNNWKHINDSYDFIDSFEDKNKLQKLLKNELFWTYAIKLNRKWLENIVSFYDDKWKSIAWFDQFLYAWEENKENAQDFINILNNSDEESVEEVKKLLLKKPTKLSNFLTKNDVYKNQPIESVTYKWNKKIWAWVAGAWSTVWIFGGNIIQLSENVGKVVQPWLIGASIIGWLLTAFVFKKIRLKYKKSKLN